MCVWRVRYFLWPPLQKQEEGERRGFWHREIKASSSSFPYYFSIRFIEWQRLTTTKQNLFIYPPFFGSLVRPLLFCPKFDGRFRKQTFPATLRFPYIFSFSLSLEWISSFRFLGEIKKFFFCTVSARWNQNTLSAGDKGEKIRNDDSFSVVFFVRNHALLHF